MFAVELPSVKGFGRYMSGIDSEAALLVATWLDSSAAPGPKLVCRVREAPCRKLLGRTRRVFVPSVTFRAVTLLAAAAAVTKVMITALTRHTRPLVTVVVQSAPAEGLDTATDFMFP